MNAMATAGHENYLRKHMHDCNNCYLGKEEIKGLKVFSKNSGVSIARIIRRAVKEYLITKRYFYQKEMKEIHKGNTMD